MKVMTVIGARPQFIKAAVVSRALKEHRKDIKEIIVHTGQHYDANMSDVFFNELDIPRPDYNLGIGGGTHGQNTGRMVEQLESLMMAEVPSRVLVYGDTDSTLAAALAASKLHIPVGHVEAGLRSFNRRMPEEINRILTDHIADLLLVPTEAGRNNLIREGLPLDNIKLVGDVMYDAALFYKEKARVPVLPASLVVTGNDFVLCTVHRAENTDDPDRLRRIFEGLANIVYNVIMPIHPRTKSKVSAMGISIPGNVWTIDPVGYLEMVWLEVNCLFVATDSGGVQKEAYFHGKRCLVLREETEWVELVESGWNLLVGVSPGRISNYQHEHELPKKTSNIYGEGDSAIRIMELLQ